MVWEFLKKIPSPLKAVKAFRHSGRWFEAGDSVDWMKLAIGVRAVYKLIHDGFLEDPFREPSEIKPPKKKKGRPKKKIVKVVTEETTETDGQPSP